MADTAIQDTDKQAFQEVIRQPGFFTMEADSQKKALRNVGVFSKADDTTLDRVLGSLKRVITPEARANPTTFTPAPPQARGAVIQPVGKTEGIREEIVRGALQPGGQGPSSGFHYEAKNGDMVMVPGAQPGQGAGAKWSQFQQGITNGMVDVGVDLTSPGNLAMIGASFLKFPKMASKFPKMFGLAKAAVKGTFGVQMLEGVLDEIPEAKKAFDRGDYETAGRAVSKGLVDLGFLGSLSKEPAEKGVSKLRGKATPMPPMAPSGPSTPPPPSIEAVTPQTKPSGKVVQMPKQSGLFDVSTATTPPPPAPSAPVQAQGVLAGAATEAFGASLGQEYVKAVQSGDKATIDQLEGMLSPEQRKPLDAAKGGVAAQSSDDLANVAKDVWSEGVAAAYMKAVARGDNALTAQMEAGLSPEERTRVKAARAAALPPDAGEAARPIIQAQVPNIRRQQMIEENKPVEPVDEESGKKKAEQIAKTVANEPEQAKVIPFPGKGESPTPQRPLWELTPEELDTAIKASRGSDKQDAIDVFGPEGAKKYEAAYRRANNTMDPEGADTAQKIVDEMESSLSEPQRNQLFGIGQPERPNTEDLREYRSALGRLDFSSAKELGESLKWAVTKAGINPNPLQMNASERVAYAQLRYAYQKAAELGFDPREISQSALKGASSRFSDPADAAFMLKQFTDKGTGAQPPSNVPAIGSSTSASGRSRELWTSAEPVPPVGDVVPMDPKTIVADPERFQFKREAIGKGGTTPKLEEVEKFDPRKGGVIAVWKDPADGKIYVSNGHHRLELAKRSDAPRINVQFLEAKDAQSAMQQGALINLGEGQGTATDAAKLFRDTKATPEDLKRENLPIKGKLVKQGLALAKLDPSIFQMVIQGTIETDQGAIMGEKLGDNPVQQKKVAEYLAKRQKDGETVKPGKLAEFIDLVRGAETQTETVMNLFGEEEITKSLVDEKAEISTWLREQLGKEKRLFGTVGKKGAGETLKRGGNVINEEESSKISEEAGQALAVYDKLKVSAGPVSNILNDAARELAEGGKSADIKARAYERIRQAVADLLTGKPPGEQSSGVVAGRPEGPTEAGGKGNGSGMGTGLFEVTPPPPGFKKEK